MPSMVPTTLFVAGSISITLSPAALVCTIRTVAALRVAATRQTARATKRLVFIGTHFKLCSHVVDPLFHGVDPGGPSGSGAGTAAARLRGLQGEGRAALSREAPRPRAMRGVPLDRHRLPPPAAVAGAEDLERRAVAEELRHAGALRPPRRALEE